MAEKIRISGPTLKLLKLLLENPKEGRSGAEISKITKLGSGTMYPLLQRLEIAKWIEGEWEKTHPFFRGQSDARQQYRNAGAAERCRAVNVGFGAKGDRFPGLVK